MDELDVTQLAEERPAAGDEAQLKAILEAIVYVTDEPLSAQQMAAALGAPIDKVKRLLDEIAAEFAKPEHGLTVREVAGGYQMSTKPEHHEAVRAFVKKLTPPLKLSLPASGNSGGGRVQTAGDGPGDHGDSRRAGRGRPENSARPQADRRIRAEERCRQADSV